MDNNQTVAQIVRAQRAFFNSGKTLEVAFRIASLKRLYKAIEDNLGEIHSALKADLGKSAEESYMCETGLALSELSFMLKNLKRFSKPQRVKTPLAQSVSKSYRLPSPYGVTAVLSPWNYPFLLSIDPLIDAVSAGNTVVLKTSANAPYTGKVIKKVVEEAFENGHVNALCGSAEVNESLLKEKFDYIFFTGSKGVGKKIYESASKNLTPVTLELGGKSPCIVEKSANIEISAKRIVWGKFLNCGQTCVAPDYILCDSSIKDKLIEEIKKQIKLQFGENPLENQNYGKIVSARHYERICSLIDEDKIFCGGQRDEKAQRIAPTVLDNVVPSDKVMGEEIFGPVLPVMTYNYIEEAIEYVKANDAPLAFYIFSNNKKLIKKLTTQIGFGGGCVNDVVIHLATPYMPFGGFGESGLGSYHGKCGFETFSHYKSIVDKKTFIDLPMRYQPFKKFYQKLVKLFLH
ncbi:MAG: aldehyde dehydrogenase [Candidatus Coproplasma sp.]